MTLSEKILICLISCIFVCTQATWASERLRIALIEYPPFMSQELEGYGAEPAIVKSAFQQVNIKVGYRFLPPARVFKTVQNGAYDAAVGWVWSAQREHFFYFSDALLEGPLVFFHLKNFSFNWTGYDDLKDIQIGTVLKNHYGPKFQKALDEGKIEIQEVANDILNFEKLLKNRIQLFPLNVHIGYSFIQKNFNDKIASRFTHHPRPLKISVYHVLFSKAVKTNASNVKLFNQGLRRIRKSGDYQRILKKYNLN